MSGFAGAVARLSISEASAMALAASRRQALELPRATTCCLAIVPLPTTVHREHALRGARAEHEKITTGHGTWVAVIPVKTAVHSQWPAIFATGHRILPIFRLLLLLIVKTDLEVRIIKIAPLDH